MRPFLFLLVLISVMISSMGMSQDVNYTLGVQDSVRSEILDESRQLIIHLPKDYASSEKKYPVVYLLDGLESNLIEAIHVTHNLRTQFIIVAIPNTDRNRDMMPLSTPTFEVAVPGAEHFLSFIEKELIPHVEQNYRSNGNRTIRGRSLSGLFVMYAFLQKPHLFNNYIGNSAGWYADMHDFFMAHAEEAFQDAERFNGKTLFVANSLVDPFDPNKEVHHAMLELSEKIRSELGDRLSFKYVTYDNYGHVPFPSFYDGLRFVLGENP